MNLFQTGVFKLSSGRRSPWKIECDALTREDWDTLALLISLRVNFGEVEGVPRGGLPLAQALQKYCSPHSPTLLIVDDVCSTGESLERHRNGRKAKGFVVFARSTPPSWCKYMFRLGFDDL
jgi:orotate phosphoribosyltransferase